MIYKNSVRHDNFNIYKLEYIYICNKIYACPTIFCSKQDLVWNYATTSFLWGSYGLIRVSITVNMIINGCHLNRFVFSDNLKLDHGKISLLTLYIVHFHEVKCCSFSKLVYFLNLDSSIKSYESLRVTCKKAKNEMKRRSSTKLSWSSALSKG